LWKGVKRWLFRSPLMNAMIGDVVFVTPRQPGRSNHSYMEWRVKRSVDGKRLFVGAAMIPDGYAGPDGSVTNYIQFDLNSAIEMRERLDACIRYAWTHADVDEDATAR
jgi:hypothetical protein